MVNQVFASKCISCGKIVDNPCDEVTLTGKLPKEIGGGEISRPCHKSCWDKIQQEMNPHISIGFEVDEAKKPVTGTFTARFF